MTIHERRALERVLREIRYQLRDNSVLMDGTFLLMLERQLHDLLSTS